MAYVPTLLIILWLIGLLLMVGRWMENIRIIHNNLRHDAANSGYMKPGWIRTLRFRFSNIDPECLNEVGRGRLNGAIWSERMMYAWMVAGIFLVGYLF